jgi:hypothetical protein
MKYQDLLESFRNGPRVLEEAVRGVTKELADYRPFDGAWTIREHVVHVTDNDINNFIRWKSIIAQPRSNTFVIHEEEWVKNMKHSAASIEKYLAVFRLLREIGYDYLIEVDEKEWDNEYVLHADGGRITLERCITIYTNHIPSHIEYIERNKRHWSERS